ncbi:hypothetical protein BCEP4_1170025 [Burkholderia cepacia]|nr:hypothetical protein BCEP4_1170025 [Burkholderia cepacia]
MMIRRTAAIGVQFGDIHEIQQWHIDRSEYQGRLASFRTHSRPTVIRPVRRPSSTL